jgi:hypothetical protein
MAVLGSEVKEIIPRFKREARGERPHEIVYSAWVRHRSFLPICVT